MIKALGIGFFALLGLGLLYFGYREGDSGALAVGGMTLVFAALLLLGATVFRARVDTAENARIGKKIIRKALERRILGD